MVATLPVTLRFFSKMNSEMHDPNLIKILIYTPNIDEELKNNDFDSYRLD